MSSHGARVAVPRLAASSRRVLLDAALAPSTLKKYKTAVTEFLEWLERAGLEFSTPQDCDRYLTEYITSIFISRRGAGKSKATCTVAGIGHYMPDFRHHLPSSTLALKGWNKVRPSKSWRTITWDLTVLFANNISERSVKAAIGLLLGFDCYLRINELLRLRTTDVVDSDSAKSLGSEYKGMSIALRKTKTGPNQWVQVEDLNVRRLVRYLLRQTKPGALLFGFSDATFRRQLHLAAAHFGLGQLQFTAHSLRHGGATRDFLRGRDLEWIRLRGRWSSMQSLQRYLNAGVVMLISTQVPKHLEHRAAQLTRDPYRAVLVTD
jgi:integrase